MAQRIYNQYQLGQDNPQGNKVYSFDANQQVYARSNVIDARSIPNISQPPAVLYYANNPQQSIINASSISQKYPVGDYRQSEGFDSYYPDKNRRTMAPDDYEHTQVLYTQPAPVYAQNSFTNASIPVTANPQGLNTRATTSLNQVQEKIKSQDVAETRLVQATPPRRKRDQGQFLCGKWGWILAALLITAILTISLLFGLGIIGGSPKANNTSKAGKVGVTLPSINTDNESIGESGRSKLNGGNTSPKANNQSLKEVKGETKTSSLPIIQTKTISEPISPKITPKETNGKVSNSVPPTTQPVQPIRPIQPIKPDQPIQPIKPIQPIQPIQPPQPTRLAQPAQSTQPTQPVQPVQPSQPSQPIRQPVIEPPAAPLAPPAPLYRGQAKFDVYPNYVMAIPVKQ